ncbi:ABC transporter ATP-binding protein [Streptomyces spectabilis]|uniref:ABC transporter ATP-binding protein n=1 Tax=Streptomyces spectabilis TaxID=68270 RepID=A0A516RIU6_STRST|nr:ABC transporter ATP-binding protein [Streptomyces spectabilis]QDQ15587.1 ABC transporter ATP-binding protein [Streptomyces spectabilis]
MTPRTEAAGPAHEAGPRAQDGALPRDTDTARPGAPGASRRAGRRALLRALGSQRAALAVGTALNLLGGGLALLQPMAAKWLVDGLAEGRSTTWPLVLLGVLVLFGALVVGASYFVLERGAEAVLCSTRQRLTDRLLRLRVPEWERHEPGDLIARATSDTTLLRQIAVEGVVAAVTGTAVTLATLVLMSLLDLVLLAVTLLVIVLVGLAVGAVAPRIARAARRTQEAVGAMGSGLERVLGAFRTVKAAGTEQQESHRLHAVAERARRTGVSAAVWQSTAATASALAVQLSFLIVLGVGGARVASGAISVATLVAFLLYLFSLAPRVGQLAEAVGQFQLGVAAAARIDEVETMSTETVGPRLGTTGVPARVRTGPAAVAFDRVCFAYRDGHPAAHHQVSFTVPAGGTTAFVGPSGAGKTTVFSLIERFHDPDSGRVLVDGADVRHWHLPELRTTIGYVEQDSPVLAGTLRDNLVYGVPHPTETQLEEVVHRTRLDALVHRLPHGLDTPVGHRGGRLSGGERQRVAIARALLRRPRLLLLDEATSQLDAANEAALRDTVTEAARTTTVLVVAHRLSTVAAADRIVVMEEGRVRAVGTHPQLLAGDALYRQLAATQFLTREGRPPRAGPGR